MIRVKTATVSWRDQDGNQRTEEITLKACPFCGFLVEPDNDDCIYPISLERKVWTLNCYEAGGGCAANVIGRSVEECVERWNKRVES